MYGDLHEAEVREVRLTPLWTEVIYYKPQRVPVDFGAGGALAATTTDDRPRTTDRRNDKMTRRRNALCRGDSHSLAMHGDDFHVDNALSRSLRYYRRRLRCHLPGRKASSSSSLVSPSRKVALPTTIAALGVVLA